MATNILVTIQKESLINDLQKDISKLQDEIDKSREDYSKPQSTKPVLYKPKNLSFDAILTRAGVLVVLGLSLSLASQSKRD